MFSRSVDFKMSPLVLDIGFGENRKGHVSLESLGIWWLVYVVGICQNRLGKWTEQKGEWEGLIDF